MNPLTLLFLLTLTAAVSLTPITESYHDHISSVAFMPDGHRFVTGGLDNTIKTFLIDGKLESTVTQRDYINCVAISHDGKYLAVGGDGFTFEIYQRKKEKWVPFQSFSAPIETAGQLKKHERHEFLLGKVLDTSFSSSGDLVVASGGWESGIVALLQLRGGIFVHVDTFDGLFTKWAVSSDVSHDGKHVLTASPDQAISILELSPSETMTKPSGTLMKWFLRDDSDRWQQVEQLVYKPSLFAEFHRLSNNIQNYKQTSTNNFVRGAKWLTTTHEFATVGHEGHVRVYSWSADHGVFNATHHWQDNYDDTPIAALDSGTLDGKPYFVTLSHGCHINVMSHVGTWRHTQRYECDGDYYGGRAVAVSRDGKHVVIAGNRLILYKATHDTTPISTPMTTLNLDSEIRERHYRIE